MSFVRKTISVSGHKPVRKFPALGWALVGALGAFAAQTQAAPPVAKPSVPHPAAAVFPSVTVKPGPAGLLEIDGKAYLSADGQNLILAGKVIDLRMLAGQPLPIPAAPPAAQPQAQPQLPALAAPGQAPQQRQVAFNSLPLEKSIKIVKGDGSRKFAVFTDVDCPFCKQLEETLATVDNVTMHVFLMPIAALHPDARRKSEAIWCAGDEKARVLAWDGWWKNGVVPSSAPCPNPVADIVALGANVGVNGTPTLIRASDGQIMPGAAPKEMLEAWLAGR